MMDARQIGAALLVAGFLAAGVVLPAAAQQKQPAKQPVKKEQPVKKKDSGAEADRKWRISVGFQAGCFWWEPVWQKYIPKDVNNGVDKFTYKMGPNAIYGPVLGFTINERLSLSWSFQYGRYQATALAFIIFPPISSPGKIRFTAEKMDSDLLALVTVSKYVKLFFGPRYQGYRYNEKFLLIKSSPVAYHSLSLGFGCALTVPIGANFYFLPNASMVGLVGWEEQNPYRVSYSLSSQSVIAGAVGVNALANFGYFIHRAGLTVTAGFRAQYLYYLRKTRTSYGNRGDLFFGPSFAVVYTY